MKILEYVHGSDYQSVLYVGNEFSPDPLDMLQKIKSITQIISTKGNFDKRLDVTARNDNEYYEVEEAVKNLLTKNGYVAYNPCIVNIQCK